jgi:hypothetical protein
MLTSQQVNDVAGTILPDTQSSSEHMRAYQRKISSIAAGTQVDLARVTQLHGRETSRAAQALADEVARVSVEAADRDLQQKEELLKKVRNPLQHDSAPGGKATRANVGAETSSKAAGASMQSDSRADRASSQGNTPGQAVSPAQKPDKK